MEKINKLKKRRAQQLVEFLLLAPFMIILLGILTEYAYALNINMSLTQALKAVTASMYYEVKPNESKADILSTVKGNLATYLDANNIAIQARNNLTVNYVILGNTTVFTASYKYIPAFTLPMMYVKFLPNEFNFLASSAVPTAFLNGNNYSTTDTSTLNGVWAGGRKGVFNVVTDQGKIIFLVWTAGTQYKTFNWSGWDNCVLDSSTAKLSGAGCGSSGLTFQTYLTNNGYTSIIFVHDGAAWCDDVRNRALGLADSSGLSRGNYDNLNVSLYNSGIVSGETQYSVTAVPAVSPYSEKVFAYTPADNITALK